MCVRNLVAIALILASGLAAYSNSFTDVFVGLDAKQSIRDNPHIRQLWPPSEALSLPLCGSVVVAEQHPTVACRPMFSLILAMTHHFFGLEPPAYHGVNIAIHITASLVLFAIVARTLKRRRYDAFGEVKSIWLALAAALIWLLHPLQTESVTYVIQISETLTGLILLLTVYCAMRGLDAEHRRWWDVGAIVACACSLGSKPSAIVAPLLVLAYDHTFVSSPPSRRYRPMLYAAMALLAAASVLALPRVGEVFSLQKTVAYALSQPGVILHYLRLSLWPDDLFLYVNTTLFAVDSAARALLPGMVLLALMALTLWGLARRQWFGFLGAWFFLTLAPTSSVIPITDRIQEHRMYLPLAALAVLAVLGGDAALRAALTPRLSERGRAIVGTGLLLMVLLGLGVRTYSRNWDYHREFTMIHPADLHENYRILADHYLSQDTLIEAEARNAHSTLSSPDSDAHDVLFAHFVLGLAHDHNDERQQAATELERVLQLDPGFAYAHHRLGIILRAQGRLAEAIDHLREAIRLEPNFVYTYKELALALKATGDTAGAAERLEQALGIQPGFAESHYELGIMALDRGDTNAAAEQFRQAVRDRPDLAEAHYELGQIAVEQRDADVALHHFDVAVRLHPGLTEAHFQLGILRRDRGDLSRAAEHLEQAVRLRPDSADFHTELARVLLLRGNTDAASEHLQRALAIDGEYAQAKEGLEEVQRQRSNSPRSTSD